jgi:hypothetical protein
MDKIIEEQLAGRRPDEVEELSIDNCTQPQISGLTDEYVNLEILSLMNNGLTSLKGFPSLPQLRKLDLSDNQLADGLELLNGCPNLEFLILSGNQFKDVSSLEALKKLKQLQSLEVFNCPLTDKEDYRKHVFELLEDISYVDGFNRDGQPAPNDDDDDDGEDGSDDDDERESEDGGEGPEEGDEEEDDGSDEDNEDAPRGTKRKHDDEEDA